MDMFVKIDGVVIQKDYIGYAYVKEGLQYSELYIHFKNHNQYNDSLTLKYDRREDAEKWLDEILKIED